MGWETKTLAEAARFRPPVAEARRRVAADALVSFVPMEDLGIDQKLLVPKRTKPFREVAGSYTYFADGDVLLAKITPCFENGKLGIAAGLSSGIGFGSSEYVVLRPGSGLTPEWLYYFLSREAFRVQGAGQMAGAVGHRRVAKEFIERYPIPIPPPDEQRRIVSILDDAFKAIATTRANTERDLSNARELFKSHLQSVFDERPEGWVESRLVDLCDAKRGITYGVIKLGDEVSEGVPCLRTSNVRWLRIETDGIKRIAPGLSDQYARTILRGGEVLVSVRGTLGGVAVVPGEMAGWNVSREVAVVPVESSRAVPAFVAYFIGSGVSQDWLSDNRKGATYVGVNLEDLRLLPVVVPGLDEQSSIVRRLRAVEEEAGRLESVYRAKTAKLEELRQSLLLAAFTGAL